MNIFSKARVRTAVSSRTNMKFSPTHITTGDFFQLSVPYIRHLVPGQSIDVNFNCFSRLAPLPVPTLGNLDIKHHAFFVPFRTVMPSWDDFITDAVHTEANTSATYTTSGIIPFAHRVNIATFTEVLSATLFSTSVNVQAASDLDKVDFTFVSGSSQETMNYQQFTQKGRIVYKILRQLGYDIASDTSAQAYTEANAIYVSALPLLCLTRLYVDWYYPSQYVGDANYNTLMSVLKHDPVSGYTLTNADVFMIFTYLSSVCYDSDYFTSAFDNPAGPNNGFYSSFQVPDISLASATGSGISGVAVDSNGTPVGGDLTTANVLGGSSSSNRSVVSAFLLNSLHALSDYMKRHQLVGSRAVDRYLARFGIKLEQSDRSLLLGSASQGVQLGAIMSNADTEGARLGDYAGQGYSNDGASFSFTSDKDYGIFFVVSTIMPRIGYVQGVDRNIFHLTKLDFHTPEFDALGTQAISAAELRVNGLQVTDDANDIKIGSSAVGTTAHAMFKRVFGFTPRYAEYKTQQDKLTGDFNLKRLSSAGFTSDSWHLFRLFGSETPSDYVHSKAFTQGFDAFSSASQYDRIFGVTNGSADHFVLVYNFHVSSSFPGKPLFDTYDFDDDKGRVIETEVGGVKVN